MGMLKEYFGKAVTVDFDKLPNESPDDFDPFRYHEMDLYGVYQAEMPGHTISFYMNETIIDSFTEFDGAINDIAKALGIDDVQMSKVFMTTGKGLYDYFIQENNHLTYKAAMVSVMDKLEFQDHDSLYGLDYLDATPRLMKKIAQKIGMSYESVQKLDSEKNLCHLTPLVDLNKYSIKNNFTWNTQALDNDLYKQYFEVESGKYVAKLYHPYHEPELLNVFVLQLLTAIEEHEPNLVGLVDLQEKVISLMEEYVYSQETYSDDSLSFLRKFILAKTLTGTLEKKSKTTRTKV